MEQLKVKRKDIIVTNVLIHLGLAFLFLYLQYAYRHHLSPFSIIYLRKSAELFWYVALPIVISAVMVWKHHRFAIAAYNFCILLVGFKVIEGLFIEFNKIIVVALFFYAVVSYFLYQLLGYYYRLASINANYSSSDLFDPLLRKIPCTFIFEDQNHKGYLTNWDEEGCFAKLEAPKRFPRRVKIIIDFKGREFTQDGEVVAESLDLSGVGIKFEQTTKDLKVFNWSEFNDLIHELGFKPERLR
jgi:hypothetical protein